MTDVRNSYAVIASTSGGELGVNWNDDDFNRALEEALLDRSPLSKIKFGRLQNTEDIPTQTPIVFLGFDTIP